MFQSLKTCRVFLIHWCHVKSEYLSECTEHSPLKVLFLSLAVCSSLSLFLPLFWFHAVIFIEILSLCLVSAIPIQNQETFPYQELWPWLVWLSGLSADLQTKGCCFDSLSGHMPWLQVRSPVRGHMRGNHPLIFLSLSPFLPLFL